jgi:hypothetical protein
MLFVVFLACILTQLPYTIKFVKTVEMGLGEEYGRSSEIFITILALPEPS